MTVTAPPRPPPPRSPRAPGDRGHRGADRRGKTTHTAQTPHVRGRHGHAGDDRSLAIHRFRAFRPVPERLVGVSLRPGRCSRPGRRSDVHRSRRKVALGLGTGLRRWASDLAIRARQRPAERAVRATPHAGCRIPRCTSKHSLGLFRVRTGAGGPLDRPPPGPAKGITLPPGSESARGGSVMPERAFWASANALGGPARPKEGNHPRRQLPSLPERPIRPKSAATFALRLLGQSVGTADVQTAPTFA